MKVQAPAVSGRPRVAFRLRIKPDAASGYEKDHANVWPELLAKLKEVGISDYSIFRRDQDLVLVMRVADFERGVGQTGQRPREPPLADADGQIF